LRSRGQGLLHKPEILCVLASFMLTAVFTFAVDSDGVERDPYHSHIVVGGTPEEQARTLADHVRHGHVWGWAPAADKATYPTPSSDHRTCRGEGHDDAGRGAHVLSFRTSAAGTSIVGFDGGIIRAALWRLLADERPVAHVAAPFGGTLLDIILPVPTPPPKLV